MKNIFAVTKNDNGYDKFVLRKLSEEGDGEVYNKIFDELNKRKIPAWVSIVLNICFLIGLLLVLSIKRAIESIIDGKIDTYVVLCGIGIIIAVVFQIAILIVVHINKKYENSEEMKKLRDKLDEMDKIAYNNLQIPLVNEKMEIIYPQAKDSKDGTFKLKPSSQHKYLVSECVFFKEGNNLCIYDDISVLGIPIDSIKEIKRVEKKLYIISSDIHNRELYSYYDVIFTLDNEEYDFLIPDYEYDKLNKVINE